MKHNKILLQIQLSTMFRSQCEGGNPPARREAARQLRLEAAPVFSRCHAVGDPRVSAGVLAPSRAASPILNPQDHPLVGSCSWIVGQVLVLTLGAFREPSTLRPSCDGVVDCELLDCHAPISGRRSLSRRIFRRTRLKTPRWVGPTAYSALAHCSLPERSAIRASL